MKQSKQRGKKKSGETICVAARNDSWLYIFLKHPFNSQLLKNIVAVLSFQSQDHKENRKDFRR